MNMLIILFSLFSDFWTNYSVSFFSGGIGSLSNNINTGYNYKSNRSISRV